ncbi:MAG: C4-type zinc ribbon domain-containing protein [Desulfohalobiaceae bacterium]
MSLYIKQIEQLIRLQKVDDEILQLQKLQQEAPEQVAQLQERLQVQQKQRDELQDKINLLQEQDKKLTREIEEDNAKIKKSKNKLMMVENSKEYHAMMREMDSLEKTNRMREEEKLALEEELSSQNNLFSTIESEVEKKQQELEEMQSKLDLQLNQAQERLQELDKEREQAKQEIPKPILSRYEFIRSRLNNPVIVCVEEGVCTGCHISIPPQTFIELQKGEQILSCPNCQRLIFWKNHFAAEDLAQAQQNH